jgi:hypothetical protein
VNCAGESGNESAFATFLTGRLARISNERCAEQPERQPYQLYLPRFQYVYLGCFHGVGSSCVCPAFAQTPRHGPSRTWHNEDQTSNKTRHLWVLSLRAANVAVYASLKGRYQFSVSAPFDERPAR